jgi:hypothetical protein
MDHDTDDDRLEMAEQLAGPNPRSAAEALSAIACDQAVGDEVRLCAAEQLAAVDPGAAAGAFRAIPDDRPRREYPFKGTPPPSPPPPPSPRPPSPPR